MLRTLLLAGGAFTGLLIGAGCDAGNVLLTTGVLGGNLELIEIIGRAFGFITV